MVLLLIRTVLLFFLTLLAMSAMGKRQLGQLQPFEFVALLIISEMASLAMQSNTVTLANSVIPIATIASLQVILSVVNLKSEKMRALLCSTPELLIRNGRLSERAMARLRLNINDVQELCRAQGYFDLTAIENAIMETNGQLSIMPKTAARPLQLGDVCDDLPEERMGQLLILDGHVNQRALRAAGLDEQWLKQTLQKLNAGEARNIFVAGLDELGEFFYQRKERRRRK
ncbi:MAG: DUF421 domain-containing protein [Bacillota bacterium]|nr:DUF421 domain-containing protein [Bacillota bacterium]